MPISSTRKILNYLAFSFRIILGIVFIFSGISKILDLDSFRWALIELKFFGWTFVLFLSIAIIIAEIGVGVLLLSGLFTTFASIHLAILIIAFIWVSIFAVMHGNIEDCNCLGKVINLSYGPAHFVLLAVLFIMDLFVLFVPERLFSLDRLIKNKGIKCFLKGV
jgi:uncharacterized membrane protein YphA (DoxX/SURF4 family)